MPTYSIKAPNGKTYQIEGPKGATQADVQNQVMTQFPEAGRVAKAPSVTPAARNTVPSENRVSKSQAQAIFDKASSQLESRIAGKSEAAKRKAREVFESNPAIQRLRQNVSGGERLKDPSTQRKIKETARQRADQTAGTAGNFFTALRSGVTRGAFGIPERLAAAGAAYLPSAITGNESDASYDEILAQVRANTDAELDKSFAGNVIGQILSGGAVGGRVAKSIEGAALGTRAGAAAASALTRAPTAARVAAKVAGASGGGAAGALAQAIGEGSDKSDAATIGAIGGPAGLAAAKGVKTASRFLGSKVTDILGQTSADKILKRFTTASRDDMARAAQEFRDQTGAEPTLYEILPLADRDRLAKAVVGRSSATSERAAPLVRQRAANVGPEMRGTLERATAADRTNIVERMEGDLLEAGADPALASRAAESPLDMRNLQRAEARSRMAPVDDAVVADDVASLYPTTLQRNARGEIEEVASNPDVSSLINNVAGVLRLRPSGGEGLRVNEITAMVDKLGDIPPSSPQYLTAQNAINELLDKIAERNPEARRLADRMREQYAARFRMREGMTEGARGRTREAAPATQETSNAYDTPEGAEGRQLGQTNALGRDFGGTPQDALRSIGAIAESGQTQQALRGNLGDEAAETLTDAARAQGRSVRNLGSLSKEKSSDAGAMGVDDIGAVVLSISPSSMIRTKVWALSKLVSFMKIPERRAEQVVDMLFSQDPATTNRAIGLLSRAGNPGREALQTIARGIQTGANIQRVAGEGEDQSPIAEAYAAEDFDNGEFVEEEAVEENPTEPGNYEEILDEWYATEDPELVDLIERQSGQESGGRQFDDNGEPLESSAGALGVMQVMPATAPEAAELAGLPWDEEAYRYDPAYNKLIGIAYMKEMLKRYDGDVELALAAYNAGPGAVDRAGGVPNISETRNYVASIMR